MLFHAQKNITKIVNDILTIYKKIINLVFLCKTKLHLSIFMITDKKILYYNNKTNTND